MGRGVVEHSLRGYIHPLLEKHGSQPGGQLEWGVTSLKWLFCYCSLQMRSAARQSPAVRAKGSISGLGQCYP